jgi:hypothetical protein
MNTAVNHPGSLNSFGQALTSRNLSRAERRTRVEYSPSQLGLFAVIAAIIASILYAAAMLFLLIAAAAISVLVFSWLLILPVAIFGIVITWVGLLLGALGLL